jgi:arylsulfatase A-like enzyme
MKSAAKTLRAPATPAKVGALQWLALAAWCGLTAGWLEVATRVLAKALIGPGRMFMMSRHFLWLVPLANLLLFSAAGLGLALATRVAPRRMGWLGPRLLCAFSVLPTLMIAGPRIYPSAWMVLAWGIAVRLVPGLERRPMRLRRWLMLSFPMLLGLVVVVVGCVVAGDRLNEWREAGRPLPSGDPPNVLLIVLDTARADRLSLYGYHRGTSPTLERLARRGIRFDQARATAPWTLASHASIFTGRWPHELGAQWLTPLRGNALTLAEYLGTHGFATAGFVANTGYCSYETGLNRGFTHYEDYAFDLRDPHCLRLAVLVAHAWSGVSTVGVSLSRGLPWLPFHASLERLNKWLLNFGRKDASSLNREFDDWLSRRRDQRRPFFAFLNYFDAHAPYLPPEGAGFPFGLRPRTLGDFILLLEQWTTIDKLRLSAHYKQMASDSYDNCLAYLDQQLGVLFENLRRRGVLDRTIVIVTADHGEELGEHDLFDHGESLYRPEIRVPLLIVLPAGMREGLGVVPKVVSLRDLPATIVDLVGLAAGAPFPGRSLARLWRGSSPGPGLETAESDGAISELTAPNPLNPSRGRSPAVQGPLVSLAEGDYVYIRNERTGREQLFHVRDDPHELSDLATIKAAQPILRRLRDHLDALKER